MIIYIYSYINKINGHRYIGKTNNIERRKREHKSQAYNLGSKYYNALWPSKIRQYGYDNFDFEILEITDDQHWIEREQYWIKYYNTFKGIGYNTTEGGDSGDFEDLLTDEEAKQIIFDLKNTNLTQEKIASKYGVSSTLISNINHGQKYIQENECYPIRRNYKTLQDYSELITLLRTTTKPFREIAEICHMAESSVKKINYGKMHYDPNLTYPIRKVSGPKAIANQIKELLINTTDSFAEIARKCGSSTNTVQRINLGQTHYDKTLSYPLRK